MALSWKKGAALVIKDDEVGLNLKETLNELISNAKVKDELVSNISKMGIYDADERIVDEIQSLLKWMKIQKIEFIC